MTLLAPSGYSFAMPLSDEEKRLLAEMEAALAVDDPKLVSTLSGKVRSPKKNRMFAGILLFFTGLATLLAGLISQAIPVGIAGFVLALIGLVFIISNLAGKTPVPAKTDQRPKKPKWSASFEERWDRRQQENE